MASLTEIDRYCDERINRAVIPDFPGAANGLQIENDGHVGTIGAAVDAGLVPFRKAIEAGVDFLIVHHGLFWEPAYPVTGLLYQKYKLCLDQNLAVYSAHLPLDCHQEIGNNALLAQSLGLKIIDRFLEFEGIPIGVIAEGLIAIQEIKRRLSDLFPGGFTAIEKGSKKPGKIAIASGSGSGALSSLRNLGVDTLITGEIKQNAYNRAEEEGLNLFLCGHYATETLAVSALAREVASQFGLAWEFIASDCPL